MTEIKTYVALYPEANGCTGLHFEAGMMAFEISLAQESLEHLLAMLQSRVGELNKGRGKAN